MTEDTHDLHLISFDLCPYVERSRIILYEKGLSFQLTMIDLSDKPDWFLEISPRGKVPVLLVDDEPIFESYVINELLEEMYPEPQLFPDDPLDRAKARSWIVFNNDVLMKHAASLWFADDDKAASEAAESLREAFGKVEEHLSKRDSGEYFLGEQFGLVDAVYAPLFTRWEATKQMGHGDLMEGFTRLQDYRDTLLAESSVQKAKVDNLTERLLD